MSACWWTQPLGTPVEPDVYAIIATSSARVLAVSTRSGWPSIRAAHAVSPDRVSPATMTCSSTGAVSRARSSSSRSALETTAARVPASSAM